MVIAALAASFIFALTLRMRSIGGLLAIPAAALIVPIEIVFETFVYPAEPEVHMWWRIAVATGFFYGLLASASGYFVAYLYKKPRCR